MYQIYILPTCLHCREAIGLMKQKNIEFELIDAGISEGANRFRIFYKEHKEKIIRDGRGNISLPIIVYNNNRTMRIHQGIDGLEKFLSAGA